MTIEVLGLKVDDLGRIILPIDNPKAREAFFKEFFQTPTGKKLASFGVTPETENRVSEILEKRFGDREVTLDELSAVVEQLISVRDPAVVPPEPEPVIVETNRPRDPQGRFLSEFETWATDPQRSMKEIRARAESQPDFRAWFHSATVSQTLQDGGLRVAGTPKRAATDADRNLLGEFVRLYQITPSARLKPMGGVITLDQAHRYSIAEFQKLIEQASAVGLL